MMRGLRHLFGFLVIMAALAVIGLGALLGYAAATLPLAPGPAAVQRTALTLRAADGSPLGQGGVTKGEVVTLAQLPPHLVKAVLAIEDRRFYEHQGVDPVGVLRAALANLRARAIEEGGSTITQQLARTAFLSNQRTLQRKVQEAMIALWLEARLSKEAILERYLNTIYFGAGAWGIDGAARRYFDKPAAKLDLPESAMLAGLIRAPSTTAPTRNLAAAQRRATVVLDAMVAAGWLTPEQATNAKTHPARPSALPSVPPGSQYFADWATGEAAGLINAGAPAALVETTLAPDLQRLAERIVGKNLAEEGKKLDVGQAALVAMTPDGAVLAMVGGLDHRASQFNRAAQAHRQAGSLFKLFVYLAALQRGLTPDMTAVDGPVHVGDWSPANFDDRYYGTVTLRDAFALSLNSVAVQVASEIGWGAVAEQARGMGVRSPMLAVPALSLGAADVTLLEMTAAFAAVAADQARVEPFAIRRIVIGDQALEWHPLAPGKPTWNRDQALDLLGAVMRTGTAAAAALDHPSYGKTGTSQDHRDAWFVGFDDALVVGVWVGNDDDTPMRQVTGARLPAAIWHDFMTEAKPILRHLARTPVAAVSAPAMASATDEATTTAELRGVPKLLDTGTLVVAGQVVKLFGVQGDDRYVSQMQRFIAGREVVCAPVGDGRHRCQVGNYDLSRVVLYNGGAQSLADAPDALVEAERRAREARRGLWGG
jgi:1A family penicillin-binding protein